MPLWPVTVSVTYETTVWYFALASSAHSSPTSWVPVAPHAGVVAVSISWELWASLLKTDALTNSSFESPMRLEV